MAFDCTEQKKPLSYADLFKVKKKSTVPLETEQLRSSLSYSSNSLGDSSSSGFSTPFDSEFCSSESEDGDFIAELTRQMTEGMLHEEDDDFEAIISPVKNHSQIYADSSNKFGLYQTPNMVCQLRNQSQGNKNSAAAISSGRRLKGTESTQQKQFPKTEQNYMQYRGRDWGMGTAGSGMQAVFLGGSGPKKASSGTGVFLPRVNTDPTEPKKKPGCSTVLIPHRVLHALELHFNEHPNAPTPPLIGGTRSSNHSFTKDESIPSNGQYTQCKNQPTKHEEEGEEIMQLPQEWTY